jgi:hypothetical protein
MQRDIQNIRTDIEKPYGEKEKFLYDIMNDYPSIYDELLIWYPSLLVIDGQVIMSKVIIFCN